MPIYEFINNDSGEVFDKSMSYDQKVIFLEDNPHISAHYTTFPGMVSGVNHYKKQDAGWKENLNRIADAHPNSHMAQQNRSNDSKQAKVKELANKYGLGKVKKD